MSSFDNTWSDGDNSSPDRAQIRRYLERNAKALKANQEALKSRPVFAYKPGWEANVPDTLKDLPRWVLWRYKLDDDIVGTRWTKVLYQPLNPLDKASSTDPAHWTGFDAALKSYNRLKGTLDASDGLGFVFAHDDNLVGIDLDNCLVNGVLQPWAIDVLNQLLPTYAERSPSGAGIKLIAGGTLPDSGTRHVLKGYNPGAAIEMYDVARFFTITGDIYGADNTEIADRTETTTAIYISIKPPRPAHDPTPRGEPLASDETLLAKARAAKNGAEFVALYDEGEFPGSHSEADFALCMRLAWWFNHDHEAIDRVFRNSALMRTKWDEPRGASTYGEITIAKAEAMVEGAYNPAGDDDDAVEDDPIGGLELPVTNPKRMAQLVLRDKYHHADHELILYWRETWWTWSNAHWNVIDQGAIKNAITLVAEREFELLWSHQLAKFYKDNPNPGPDETPPQLKSVTQTFITNVLGSLQAHTRLDDVEQPDWLGAEPAPFSPNYVLPTRSAIVHLETGRQIPPTPRYFVSYALEFDYQQNAPPPTEWHKFLRSLWGDDTQTIETLQEWFGYCITPDTSQHKILLLIGPTRSGKGVITRVLRRLVDVENTAGPTLGGLAESFGLAPLVGKPLAIVGDARLSARSDRAVITERLLAISGEDTLSCNRKNTTHWTGKLPTRLVIQSNETPWLTDSSMALAGRFLILHTTESFEGREDRGLEARLATELPSILNWAIAGRKRLKARGSFVQPESGKAMVEELRELSSRISTFLADACETDPSYREAIPHVYTAWCHWCQQQGEFSPGSTRSLAKELRTVLPKLSSDKVTRIGDKPVKLFTGLRLNFEYLDFVKATGGTPLTRH